MSLHKFFDSIDVQSITAITVVISLSDVEQYLRILSIVLAAAYTLWKWHKSYKRNKEDQNKINTPTQ